MIKKGRIWIYTGSRMDGSRAVAVFVVYNEEEEIGNGKYQLEAGVRFSVRTTGHKGGIALYTRPPIYVRMMALEGIRNITKLQPKVWYIQDINTDGLNYTARQQEMRGQTPGERSIFGPRTTVQNT